MAVTTSLEQVVRDEITRAIEENAGNVTRSNVGQIFKYTILETETKWVVQCCTVCRRPKFVHQDPWAANCTTEPINQTTKGVYIDQLENHKRMKQIAREMEPGWEEVERGPRNPRLTRSRGDHDRLIKPKQTPRETLEQERFHEYTWERDYSCVNISTPNHQKKEEYRVDKKTKFKHLEFSEEVLKKEEYRVDKKIKFKHLEFSEEEMEEGRYWLRQVDDYISQNPSQKKWEEWMLRLHPADLEKHLKREENIGRFKPRNLTEKEWIEESMNGRNKCKNKNEDEDEYEDEYEEDDEYEYEEDDEDENEYEEVDEYEKEYEEKVTYKNNENDESKEDDENKYTREDDEYEEKYDKYKEEYENECKDEGEEDDNEYEYKEDEYEEEYEEEYEDEDEDEYGEVDEYEEEYGTHRKDNHEEKENKPPPNMSIPKYLEETQPFSILATNFFGGNHQQQQEQWWRQQQQQQEQWWRQRQQDQQWKPNHLVY